MQIFSSETRFLPKS